jgi:hypothetical protein
MKPTSYFDEGDGNFEYRAVPPRGVGWTFFRLTGNGRYSIWRRVRLVPVVDRTERIGGGPKRPAPSKSVPVFL